jgi:hypothetical protein
MLNTRTVQSRILIALMATFLAPAGLISSLRAETPVPDRTGIQPTQRQQARASDQEVHEASNNASLKALLVAACLGIGSPVGVVPSGTNPSTGVVPPEQPPALVVQPPSDTVTSPPGPPAGETSPAEGAPEPATLVTALVGSSLAGLWLARRRKKTRPLMSPLGQHLLDER